MFLSVPSRTCFFQVPIVSTRRTNLHIRRSSLTNRRATRITTRNRIFKHAEHGPIHPIRRPGLINSLRHRFRVIHKRRGHLIHTSHRVIRRLRSLRLTQGVRRDDQLIRGSGEYFLDRYLNSRSLLPFSIQRNIRRTKNRILGPCRNSQFFRSLLILLIRPSPGANMKATSRLSRFPRKRVPSIALLHRSRASHHTRFLIQVAIRVASRSNSLTSRLQLRDQRHTRGHQLPSSIHSWRTNWFSAVGPNLCVTHRRLNVVLYPVASERVICVGHVLSRRSFDSFLHLQGEARTAAKTPVETIARLANGTPSGPNVQTVGLRADTGTTPTGEATNVEAL